MSVSHVIVDSSQYVRSHLRAPRGYGSWAFCTVDPRRADYLDHVIWAQGTYGDAKKDAQRRAVRAGHDTLYVCS